MYTSRYAVRLNAAVLGRIFRFLFRRLCVVRRTFVCTCARVCVESLAFFDATINL